MIFKFTLILAIIFKFDILVVFRVTQSDVRFFLYTPESPNNPTELVTGQMADVVLDNRREFKFIIHGYIDNANKPWVLLTKDEYLLKGPYNVITVDWSVLTYKLYPIPAQASREVGEFIARFIIDLHNTLGVLYDLIHLVSHSLGSHVSGFCGKYLLNTVSDTVSRISGIDPAGPFFFSAKPDERLAIGDAKFIDVIHTDGYEFGYFNPIGDIDFYPNGGFVQPGCVVEGITEILFACSHARSYRYFIESINSFDFIANKCDSYNDYSSGSCSCNEVAVMGENVNRSQTGSFYLYTNSKPPFAKSGRI